MSRPLQTEAVAPAAARRKVAIVGAGPAGLAAAFGLSAPELAARFEVHVYQMGWRAGGKAGTGRNADKGHRVEQNGSHYLFGCYHQAFAMVRQAYRELGPHAGFGRFADNFTPCNVLAGAAWRPPAGDGRPSFVIFPTNLSHPGTGGRWAQPFDYLLMALQLILGGALALLGDGRDPAWGPRLVSALFPLCPYRERTVWRRAWGRVLRALLWLPALLVNLPCRAVWLLLRRLPVRPWRQFPERWRAVARARLVSVGRAGQRAGRRFWRAARDWVLDAGIGWGWPQRLARLAVLADLASAVTVGILVDRLWRPGSLEAIDHLDFRAWLSGHGAAPEACQSVYVKCWYDAVIAYEGGDPERPRIAAGVALNAIFKAFLTYKGSFAYQMGHEMGDGWVAPVVQALIARGVRFHFFHRLWDLLPGRDDSGEPVVEGLVIERQIGERAGHDLFARLPGGRLVWPDRPLFQGEPAIDLEVQQLDSFYGRDSEDRIVLRRGQDFDDVVCTIPGDALPHQAPSCYREQPRWQRMVEHVDCAESVSLRIWFRWPLSDLGWPHPEPILSGFDWPFSTWEDNCQSLGHESFPPDDRPGAVATVFGSLRAPRKAPGRGAEGLRELRRQERQARRHARRFWQRQVGGLWPALGDGRHLGAALFRPRPVPRMPVAGAAPPRAGRDARTNLRWQLLRANVGPLERYVLALPGTLQHRLRPRQTGYTNLLFAGDWTRNGVEVGCAEGAVISGLQAARALTGFSTPIVGEDDVARGLLGGW